MAVLLIAHAEFILFAVLGAAAFGIQGFWLRRAKATHLPWLVWILAAVLTAVTGLLAVQAGDRERTRIQKGTQDFARLYGSEIEKQGHSRLASDAAPDDPLYLELIATEKRWLALSPSVNDIYTLRKLPDGRNVLIVDSETDYDRDGKYEGEREQRTAVGEVYGETIPTLEQAFMGKPAFSVEPITDRWGTWVSAFVPLHALDGRMEAVLGVDFDAATFAETIAAAEGRVVGFMSAVQIVLLAASTLTSVLRADSVDRRRAAEALRKNEAQLQTIVENLTDGVIVSDLDGRLLHFNRAALSMHGFESLPDDQRHLAEFARTFDLTEMNGAALPPERWPLARILRGENLRDVAVRGRQSEAGWERVFSYSGSLVHDPAGRPQFAVVTISDITERTSSEAELARAHRDLVDVSRHAGRAEVATGVLHNVGNVLNSVNVAATCVADGVRQSKLRSLPRAVALLREHEQDLGAFFSRDPRGARFPEYLAQLASQFASEQSTTLTEVARLQTNIEHIKDIVAAQQSYAKVSGLAEKLDVAGLVEDTLRMSAESLTTHRVQVVREFAPVPPVIVDKHKVLQILVNLVGNAKHACAATDRPDRTVTVRIFNGDGTVKIAVVDNGIGIPPENLQRIFNHGFTTKPTGHGFGLHSGALAAREIGGCLKVHSEGAGRGATFTLVLPLAPSSAG